MMSLDIEILAKGGSITYTQSRRWKMIRRIKEALATRLYNRLRIVPVGYSLNRLTGRIER